MLRPAFIPLLLLAALCPALGQQPQQDVSKVPTKTVVIHRIDNPHLKLDGKLDEPVWQQVEPFGDLVQTDPDLGAPVSEKTESVIQRSRMPESRAASRLPPTA